MGTDEPDMAQQENAFINDVLDRKPSPYSHLLSGGNRTLRGLIGPSVSTPSGLVEDYFELAHHAAHRTTEQHKVDLALLPVLYLYRHAVELALKYVVVLLIRAVEQGGGSTTETVPEGHDLEELLKKVNTLFPAAKAHLSQAGEVEPISGQAQAFIRELHKLDPSGEVFRYVHTKARQGRKLQIQSDLQVDVDALVQGMVHIEKEVTWFMNNVENGIGMIEDFRAEMLSDAGW